MGTHLRELSESYPMNINMIGLRCFSKISAFEGLTCEYGQYWGTLSVKGSSVCIPLSLFDA